MDVLFWSGGKDSFLALRAWLRRTRNRGLVRAHPVLFTTFQAATRVVAHQEVPIAVIERQARHLGLPLIGVPLHAGLDYLDRVRAGMALLTRRGHRIRNLVFGDLHLQHIRSWRDTALVLGGAALQYPLWQSPATTLLEDLERSGVPCVVTALGGGSPSPLKVGDPFHRKAAAELSAAGCDPFGENGEFHTLARVWEAPRAQAARLDCGSDQPEVHGCVRAPHRQKTGQLTAEA